MTNFNEVATERPRYFPGQYLLEDDFELQHKYLSDRLRYQNQSLHVSGIIEGLEVEVIQERQAVMIKSGSAINNLGELIVLENDTNPFSDFNSKSNGELYIKYKEYYEKEENKQQKNVDDSYTRWIEKPLVGFEETTPDNGVKLATLTIAENGDITTDPSIREYSGLSLPNSNGEALTLRSGGNANPNVAALTGSLQIDENLTVAGTGTSSFAGKLEVTGDVGLGTSNQAGYKLTVQGNQYLDGDLTVTGTISGNINAASIKWEEKDVDRIPKLSADKITSGTIAGNLTVNGGVGIGINDPGSYKLYVQGNQYISRDLDVEGRILRMGQHFSYAGKLSTGQKITPPWGTPEDWTLIVSPWSMGADYDNVEDVALEMIECYAKVENNNSWVVTSRFKLRVEGKSYWIDSPANYLLVPR